jgi:hypothetical protein
MKQRTAVLLPAAALLAMLLAGCQAVFTTSPFSFLQRDPADLPPEQQAAWAEQALASGDPAAMAKAYAVIKDNPDQAYLAASLAAELSGVPQALADAIADLDTILDWTTGAEAEAYFDAFLTSVDSWYAAEAAVRFDAVLTSSPSELTGTDMVMGALCLAFVAADASGSFATADFTAVHSFVADCLLVLPPGDPAADLLSQVDIFGT